MIIQTYSASCKIYHGVVHVYVCSNICLFPVTAWQDRTSYCLNFNGSNGSSPTPHWSSWACVPLHQAKCLPCVCYGGGLPVYHLLDCCGCLVCLHFHMVCAAWIEPSISGCKNASAIATFANDTLHSSHSSMSGGMYPVSCQGNGSITWPLAHTSSCTSHDLIFRLTKLITCTSSNLYNNIEQILIEIEQQICISFSLLNFSLVWQNYIKQLWGMSFQ